MLQDLDPGTKYGMLWFVACSTVNANSCQQLDAQECSQGPVIFLDETADPQDDEPGQEWLYAERGRPARGPVRAYLIIYTSWC